MQKDEVKYRDDLLMCHTGLDLGFIMQRPDVLDCTLNFHITCVHTQDMHCLCIIVPVVEIIQSQIYTKQLNPVRCLRSTTRAKWQKN